MILSAVHKKPNRDKSCQQGFTLIELLIVIGIIAILGVAIYTFFTNISTKSTIERSVSLTQQKTRLALEMMARDIRMMALDPSGDASAGLWATSSKGAPATSSGYFAFTADINYDGDLNDPFEQILYYVENGALMMETNVLADGEDEDDHDAAVTLVQLAMLHGVQPGDLKFRYFDENNVEITPANAALFNGQNINAVEISLTVRTQTAKDDIERTYSTMVRLRNRFN